MGSKKRSAQQKQRAAFQVDQSAANNLDALFAQEGHYQAGATKRHEQAQRRKACESKNRYASLSEAQAALHSCADYSDVKLHIYKCSYCAGWHLTSKPQR